MAFDLFAVIMAVLSVLSFGAIASAEVTEQPTIITPVEEIPEPNVSDTPTQTETPTPTETKTAEPTETEMPPPVETQKIQEGSDKIAGAWKGTESVPLLATVTFNAVINEDGTAHLSGNAKSNVVGNHVFSAPVTWTYLGGNSFDTIVQGVHTTVTCDGSKLTFPANPYRLGLINNPIADQTFIIDLYRV